MHILISVLILLPLLGGLGLLIRPAGKNHSRNVYVLCLCSLTSLLALALLVLWLLTGAETFFLIAPIFGENFSLVLRLDGLGAVFVAIVAILWPVTDLYAFESSMSC